MKHLLLISALLSTGVSAAMAENVTAEGHHPRIEVGNDLWLHPRHHPVGR